MRSQFQFALLHGLGLALIASSASAAQLPGSSTTNGAASTKPAWDVKASPAAPRTPVDFFRQLLVLPENERELALAAKPEPQRTQIRAKLLEYAALPTGEREGKLRAAELHWYFEPLVMLVPSNRVVRLAAIPAPDRRIIEQRLAQWDKLPDDMKKNVLEKQRAQQSVLALGTNTAPVAQFAPVLNPELKARRERDVAAWNQQSAQQREKMVGRFENFFTQPAPEREKTLRVLPDAERLQMEKTLQAFAKLPPSQRQSCITSFRKFDSLPPGERDQFLRTAERWRTMTPEERATWRKLVLQLPPLPPESLPPLPPPPAPRASQSVVSSTNAQP
ncbi:MAG: DUF3106 domain-containing protein [Verrucomicrobia bacterium]|nr:DUF3106 domain-containing protein [Verrucomicrobiota bacterium]